MPERISQIMVGTGKRAKVWTVKEVWPDNPDPLAWERAQAALVRLMLPKARELIAKQQAERDREAGIPEHIEGGI